MVLEFIPPSLFANENAKTVFNIDWFLFIKKRNIYKFT